jgi:uncharacterized protein (TIGR02301 family)
MNRVGRPLASLVLFLALSAAAFAQDQIPPDSGSAKSAPSAQTPPAATEPAVPVYEEKLLRLAEILGSLSLLRDLCGSDDGAAWRDEMSSLLTAEDPPPERRARLVASFNHGFETLNAVYRVCTPSARLAISRYLDEGQQLASDVRGRYSQ